MLKKINILITFMVITTSICFGSKPVKDPSNNAIKFFTQEKKKIQHKKIKKTLSRECCTSTAIDVSTGFAVQIEVCCGWFLSNSESAYERACEKAALAVQNFMSNN